MGKQEKGNERLSAKERTELLFGQNYKEVAKELNGLLLGRVIDDEILKVIRIDKVKGYPQSENQAPKYKPVLDSDPGHMLSIRFQRGEDPTTLLLITALDRGKNGACIRIEKASFFNDQGEWETFKSSREFATYLGVEPDKDFELKFWRDKPMLTMTGPGERINPEVMQGQIFPPSDVDVNAAFRRFVDRER